MKDLNQRKLRIGTWHFQGILHDRKALKIGEIISNKFISILKGQESWELQKSEIHLLVINGLVNLGRMLKVRDERWGRFVEGEHLADDVTIRNHMVET